MSTKLDRSAFTWNEYTGESKSGQIASAIEGAIQQGALVPGNKLPTVNDGVKQFGVARKTLVKAYLQLIHSFDHYLISSFNHSRIPKVISRIPRRQLLIISRMDKIAAEYYHVIQDKRAFGSSKETPCRKP